MDFRTPNTNRYKITVGTLRVPVSGIHMSTLQKFSFEFDQVIPDKYRKTLYSEFYL